MMRQTEYLNLIRETRVTGSESSMKRGLSDIYIMDRRFVRRNVTVFENV